MLLASRRGNLVSSRNNDHRRLLVMANVSRRHFFSVCGAGAAVAMLTPLAVHADCARRGLPAFGRGFGPLEPKLPLNAAELPANLRNVPILALPKGFEYTAISITGETMTDGNPVPG